MPGVEPKDSDLLKAPQVIGSQFEEPQLYIEPCVPSCPVLKRKNTWEEQATKWLET